MPVRFVTRKARCASCSRPFAPVGNQKFCTPACRGDLPRIEEKACAVCGAIFNVLTKGRKRVTCSDDCRVRRNRILATLSGSRAAARKARKLRLRGVAVEAVNPIKVLERDRWTCQLCGIRTPKKLRGTYDDRAPEIDHIIPIAEGGEHSYRNVHCACRKCNIAKAGVAKGQLRLFG